MTTIAYRSWLLIKVSNSYTVELLEFSWLYIQGFCGSTSLMNLHSWWIITLCIISLKMQVNLQKMAPMKYHNSIAHCITLSPCKIWFISKQCMNHLFLFSRHSSTNRYCHIEDKSVGHQWQSPNVCRELPTHRNGGDGSYRNSGNLQCHGPRYSHSWSAICVWASTL